MVMTTPKTFALTASSDFIACFPFSISVRPEATTKIIPSTSVDNIAASVTHSQEGHRIKQYHSVLLILELILASSVNLTIQMDLVG